MNNKRLYQLIQELTILQNKGVTRAMSQTLRSINKEAMRLESIGKLTPRALRRFITEQGINLKAFNLSVYDSFMLGDITSVASGAKIPAISTMLRFYKNPKVLAVKIHKFNILRLQGSTGQNLRGVEKNIYSQLSVHFDKNAKELSAMVNDYKRKITKITKEMASGESRAILKARKGLERKGVPRSEVEETLQKRFGSVKTSRIERVVRTETHAQQELVGNTRAIQNGFKWKVWHNNPNAGKGGQVRDTHAALNNKRVKIKQKFRVGGSWASYPGDPNLPVGQRVYCRCTMTYE